MSSPLHIENPQSDVVNQNPLSQISNHETLNQPDPKTLDREDDNNSSDDELEDEDGGGGGGEEEEISETQSISSGMHLNIDPNVSAHDVTLKSPSYNPRPRFGGIKRKKGKSKSNIKKQLAIDEKVQTLMLNLNPIPFMPHKLLDFAKHETLLKKLGLWDFVQIDFDRDIRVDLVAQLVASYEAKSRSSYVNGVRVLVNRADLARAFKFPVKKEKGGVAGLEFDVDWEVLTEESIGFIVELVSDWVLLHEDTWMMPNEVMNWLKVIRDGHPERVDWAGLVWFMVEKELTRGAQLRDCYYASHLQYLIKSQRGDLFLTVGPTNEVVELESVANEEEKEKVSEGYVKADDVIEETGEERCLMGRPSTLLTLGQGGEKEDEVTEEDEMMDVEKCNKSDEDGGEDEQGQWLSNGKNNTGEHFMQRCALDNDDGKFSSFEEIKEEEQEIEGGEDEDEIEDGINLFPNDDPLETEGITGNLLHAMETDLIEADLPPTSSFFNHTGKRVIDHDNDIPHHAFNDTNKRLRMNNSWDHNKPLDFATCMDQIHQMTEKAKTCYLEKEYAFEQSNMNHQLLLNELERRDSVIEHLHKTRFEETQKKDGQIYRLERELYLMGSVLDDYRKALKETQKAFTKYRERAKLAEESTYKDAGPGGLMLSSSDLEKLRKRQDEEFKMNCLVIEDKMKVAEEGYVAQFGGLFEKIGDLDNKLAGLEGDVEELIELYKQRKVSQIAEKGPEVSEPQKTSQTEEKMAEVAETQIHFEYGRKSA